MIRNPLPLVFGILALSGASLLAGCGTLPMTDASPPSPVASGR